MFFFFIFMVCIWRYYRGTAQVTVSVCPLLGIDEASESEEESEEEKPNEDEAKEEEEEEEGKKTPVQMEKKKKKGMRDSSFPILKDVSNC